MLVLAISCKDECKDEFCPVGFKCVDGVCEDLTGNCPIGYEGENCNIAENAKFVGNYNTDYTGSGGLSGSDGNTTAKVSAVSGKPNKVRIDVKLNVKASVVGTAIDLPLTVSIEGDVDGDTYYVPKTTLNTTFDVQGVPIPVNIVFETQGTKVSEDGLNSTLTMAGSFSGKIEMVGTK